MKALTTFDRGDRRRFLKTVGAGLAGMALLPKSAHRVAAWTANPRTAREPAAGELYIDSKHILVCANPGELRRLAAAGVEPGTVVFVLARPHSGTLFRRSEEGGWAGLLRCDVLAPGFIEAKLNPERAHAAFTAIQSMRGTVLRYTPIPGERLCCFRHRYSAPAADRFA